MRVIAIAAAAGMLGAAAPAPVGLPGWIAGCWLQEKGDAWTEECWTAARAGSMLGSGRNGTGTRLNGWEVMQILVEPDGGLSFHGAPGGMNRTRFALVSSTADEVVFANPTHDYPQRIRYRRDGAGLTAEVSLIDGSKPIRWTYRRSG